jgi:glycosyltransferase involved in cell wall biosynthesis
MNNPKVSIIVPCYNQAQYLSEALQSVLDQTYENWECIIVNDGSPDNTKEVAQEWVKKDSRFIYLYKENGGLSSARNAGLDIVKGMFIQFLDSDDLINKNKLKNTLDIIVIDEGTTYDIVISNFMMFRESIDKLLPPFCRLTEDLFNFDTTLYNWDFEFNIPIHCGFFHKSNFENFRFSETLGAKEDWIMWLNLFKNKPKICFIDLPLAYYRYHSNNMTKDATHLKSNFFNSLPKLKELLSDGNFEAYLYFLIDRFYQQSQTSALEVKKYKHSNSYKLGQKIKLILHKFYLLKISKRFFRL